MVNGTYQVIMKTPMGAKKGELSLQESDDRLDGQMIIMGKENPIESGAVDGGHVTFSGALKTAVGRMTYEADLQISGDELSGTAKTNKGNFRLTGSRK